MIHGKILVFMFLSLFFVAFQMNAQTETQKDYSTLATNPDGGERKIEIEFQKGTDHYYPLMAIWVEDMKGNYIHSLYVAQSIAKGEFEYGQPEGGKWKRSEKQIPSALPYWAHQRGVMTEDSSYMPTKKHPLPDAYTGATPTRSFVLETAVSEEAGSKFRILFEINQSWDWNKYWHNARYPGNKEYMKSAQPALVYEAAIDLESGEKKYDMKPIGHSHPYGATGELFEDLSTLTTALDIVESITIRVFEP
ncbi:MAG: hypothetical protein ACLFUH_05235 [Bacteroidales bacterium]